MSLQTHFYTTINFTWVYNIYKLVEQLVLNAQNATEGIDDMEAQVREALLRVLNGANSLANQR